MRHFLRYGLYAGIITACIGINSNGRADDQGFSRLNAVGRFLGVGYSHNGYHSGSAGRLQIVQQNHPASAYPSTYRPSPFQPAEFAYRPQPSMNYAPPMAFVRPSVGEPTKAPVMAPVEPPPKWLEPYLKEDDSTLPAPPKVRTTPVPQEKSPPAVKPEAVSPIELSPSDRNSSTQNSGLIEESPGLLDFSSDETSVDSKLKPIQQPQPIQQPNIRNAEVADDLLLEGADDQLLDEGADQLLEGDDDQLLDDEDDSLLDEVTALRNAVLQRHASTQVKFKAPDIQSNIRRYSPFR